MVFAYALAFSAYRLGRVPRLVPGGVFRTVSEHASRRALSRRLISKGQQNLPLNYALVSNGLGSFAFANC